MQLRKNDSVERTCQSRNISTQIMISQSSRRQSTLTNNGQLEELNQIIHIQKNRQNDYLSLLETFRKKKTEIQFILQIYGKEEILLFNSVKNNENIRINQESSLLKAITQAKLQEPRQKMLLSRFCMRLGEILEQGKMKARNLSLINLEKEKEWQVLIDSVKFLISQQENPELDMIMSRIIRGLGKQICEELERVRADINNISTLVILGEDNEDLNSQEEGVEGNSWDKQQKEENEEDDNLSMFVRDEDQQQLEFQQNNQSMKDIMGQQRRLFQFYQKRFFVLYDILLLDRPQMKQHLSQLRIGNLQRHLFDLLAKNVQIQTSLKQYIDNTGRASSPPPPSCYKQKVSSAHSSYIKKLLNVHFFQGTKIKIKRNSPLPTATPPGQAFTYIQPSPFAITLSLEQSRYLLKTRQGQNQEKSQKKESEEMSPLYMKSLADDLTPKSFEQKEREYPMKDISIDNKEIRLQLKKNQKHFGLQSPSVHKNSDPLIRLEITQKDQSVNPYILQTDNPRNKYKPIDSIVIRRIDSRVPSFSVSKASSLMPSQSFHQNVSSSGLYENMNLRSMKYNDICEKSGKQIYEQFQKEYYSEDERRLKPQFLADKEGKIPKYSFVKKTKLIEKENEIKNNLAIRISNSIESKNIPFSLESSMMKASKWCESKDIVLKQSSLQEEDLSMNERAIPLTSMIMNLKNLGDKQREDILKKRSRTIDLKYTVSPRKSKENLQSTKESFFDKNSLPNDIKNKDIFIKMTSQNQKNIGSTNLSNDPSLLREGQIRQPSEKKFALTIKNHTYSSNSNAPSQVESNLHEKLSFYQDLNKKTKIYVPSHSMTSNVSQKSMIQEKIIESPLKNSSVNFQRSIRARSTQENTREQVLRSNNRINFLAQKLSFDDSSITKYKKKQKFHLKQKKYNNIVSAIAKKELDAIIQSSKKYENNMPKFIRCSLKNNSFSNDYMIFQDHLPNHL